MFHFLPLLVRLLRAQTYVLLALHVLLAFLYGLRESGVLFADHMHNFESVWRFVVAFVLPGVWYIIGAALNDLADEKIDKINLKQSAERTLITGQATRRQLWVVSSVCSFMLLVLSALIGVPALLASFVLLFLSWAYSWPPIRISYRGIWAPLLLPIGYAGYPFIVGLEAAGASITGPSFLLLAGMYMLFVARVMLKDFRDVTGDKKYGKLTFLLRHSVAFVTRSSLVAFLSGVVALTLSIRDAHIVTFIGIACSTFVGVYIYLNLAQTTTWSQQRKLLPFLSRVKTIIIGLALLFLLFEHQEFGRLEYVIFSLLLPATLIWTVLLPFEKRNSVN